MSDWAGFSDADLKKLQQNVPQLNKEGVKSRGLKKSVPTSKPRPQRIVQPMKKEISSANENTAEVPAQALLSKPADPPTTLQSSAEHVKNGELSNLPEPPSDCAVSLESSADAAAEVARPATLLTDDDGMSRELTNLEQYQRQQKMMEELNRKKKKMLADALAERQKQATVEAHKLNAIKKELSHLDQMLTADVSVIRDRIETATRDYTEASKRYELAEKEFIEAKISLHKKSELKEQLTEHLYTIIHQNEVRKAKKLAELMDKLNLASQEDNSSVSLPDLPVYSLLGNMQTFSSGNLTKHSHNSSPGEEVSCPTDNVTVESHPSADPVSSTSADTSKSIPEDSDYNTKKGDNSTPTVTGHVTSARSLEDANQD